MPKIESDPQFPLYTVLGIDPGVTGGITCIEMALGKIDLRVHKVKGMTDEDLYKTISKEHLLGSTVAVIEEITPRPTFFMQNGQKKSTILKSTCTLYGNYRFLCGVLTSLGIRYRSVVPRTWQKAIGCPTKKKNESTNKWKGRLKQFAQRLYPGTDMTLDTADSVLLAHYAHKIWVR